MIFCTARMKANAVSSNGQPLHKCKNIRASSWRRATGQGADQVRQESVRLLVRLKKPKL